MGIEVLEQESLWKSTRAWWFGLLLTLLFFLTHVVALDYGGCWTDEYHTYDAVRQDTAGLIHNRTAAGHMPTYFLLVRSVCALGGGITEKTMRLPSVFAGTAAFFVFFLLVRRYLKDTRVYLTALLLLLINPYFFWASRDARMYAFVVLAAILSTYMLLLDEEKPRRRYLIGYVIFFLLGYSIHRLTACMLLPHLGMILLRDKPNRKRWLWTGCGVIALLLLITVPLFQGVKMRAAQDGRPFEFSWPDPSVLLRRWGALATTDFSTFNDRDIPRNLKKNADFFGELGVIALLMLAFVRRRLLKNEDAAQSATDRYFWRSMALWIVLPSVTLVLARMNKEINSIAPRYFFMVQPALLILLAYGFWTTLNGHARWLPRVTRGVFIAGLCGALYVQALWKGPGLRESAQYAQTVYEEGDVVFSPVEAENIFSFYHLSAMKAVVVPSKKLSEEQFIDFIQQNTAPGHKAILFITEGTKADTYSQAMSKQHADIFERTSSADVTGSFRVDVFRLKP